MGEPSAEDERELRILLERAVPRLPPPEGLLGRVRERARRTRRRRRTAAATAAAVTGLAVAGTVLPGLLREVPAPVPPSASASAVPGPSEPVPAPAGTAWQAPHAGSGVRFERVAGVTLRLPERWQALEVPDDGRLKVAARGFVSSQRLTPYGLPCPVKSPKSCLPVAALGPDDALLTLVPLALDGLEKKIEQPPVLYASDNPSPGCRAIQGTREYSGLLGGTPAPYTAVSLTLCVHGDAPGTVEDVSAMVSGADFGKGTVTAPTHTPTTAGHPPNEQ
ncbi:hypothetical protein KQY30_17100 [Streptomyces sp. GMY02]|uniref:hypothetical protein n=1 Tax=Streptomyces sp. GMY02 TaxID=1333528 RepID=UPI001C2C747E|nr:hypothetical protein [Streptomyces sp. GMY02]QXE35716.1 hypothetical protein KQY30_17100 [Streptomyces sp. GMY02]